MSANQELAVSSAEQYHLATWADLDFLPCQTHQLLLDYVVPTQLQIHDIHIKFKQSRDVSPQATRSQLVINFMKDVEISTSNLAKYFCDLIGHWFENSLNTIKGHAVQLAKCVS